MANSDLRYPKVPGIVPITEVEAEIVYNDSNALVSQYTNKMAIFEKNRLGHIFAAHITIYYLSVNNNTVLFCYSLEAAPELM